MRTQLRRTWVQIADLQLGAQRESADRDYHGCADRSSGPAALGEAVKKDPEFTLSFALLIAETSFRGFRANAELGQ